jgi:hypothetical protein
VWEPNDLLISTPGAEIMKQVLPAADLCNCEGSHFLFDEFVEAIIETFYR